MTEKCIGKFLIQDGELVENRLGDYKSKHKQEWLDQMENSYDTQNKQIESYGESEAYAKGYKDCLEKLRTDIRNELISDFLDKKVKITVQDKLDDTVKSFEISNSQMIERYTEYLMFLMKQDYIQLAPFYNVPSWNMNKVNETPKILIV